MNNNDGLRRNTNRRRSVAARKNRNRKVLIGVIIALIVLIWTATILLILNGRGNIGGGGDVTTPAVITPAETDPVTTPAETTPAVTDPVTTPAETTAPQIVQGYKEITLTPDELHAGELILINYTLGFEFVEPVGLDSQLKKIYGSHPASHYTHPNSSQLLRADVLGAFNEMMADFYAFSEDGSTQTRLAYRSYDSQKELYDKYGDSYVYPGYSEHQTGAVIDLNVIRWSETVNAKGETVRTSETYELGYFDIFDWIYENCCKYGFVLRYPESKVSKTGVGNDKDHFRYVGVAHATYMYENNLCLEEYLALLQSHTYEGEHITVDCDGKSYEIYYIAASLDEEGNITDTAVYVPENLPYTVSGNNYDGFVVTVEKN